jgi:hypothetical protein
VFPDDGVAGGTGKSCRGVQHDDGHLGAYVLRAPWIANGRRLPLRGGQGRS